ncbi:MAG: hypothetical protein RLZZ78_987 [Armatimonadota bacterium]
MYLNAHLTVCDIITHFTEDRNAWERKFPNPTEHRHRARISVIKQYEEALGALKERAVTRGEYLDTLLFTEKLQQFTRDDNLEHQRNQALYTQFPWLHQIFTLDDEIRSFSFPDGKAAAIVLDAVLIEVRSLVKVVGDLPLDDLTDRLTTHLVLVMDALAHWWTFIGGYNPDVTWWCSDLVTKLQDSLEELRLALNNHIGDELVGQPVGREVLEQHLAASWIAHSVDELIAAAEREWAWCRLQCATVVQDLGVSDWGEALELCKASAAPPGSQPAIVRDLALEAASYVTENELLTVDATANGTWRMEMMSAEDQKTNPFFLGGETIIVSYPTSGMSIPARQMSMRGNNAAFSRATVQHELIPGHHMQQWASERFHSHRNVWWTPFWVEGWTLHWEMLLWERGFPQTPQERCGMLFWRMHRCARVLFSLKFHLGEMSASECVDFLVRECGHEPANAHAEIRRSVGNRYPPLYQLAYQIGGMQVRSLFRESIARGWTAKAFHDRFLRENEMPIAAVRALILGLPLGDAELKNWRFLDGNDAYSV